MRNRAILPVLLLLAGACASSSARPAGGTRADVHPGFDLSIYPGETALRAWRQASPYRWVGYYLPSPCHRDASWSGRRAAIEGMGWGTAVIYVGQQAFEDAAPDTAPRTTPIVCSRTLLTPERGVADARDAIARARGEGFAAGSVVYLDVERMRTIPQAMLTYYGAWTAELLRDGTYVPGTYAHQANAAPLFAAARAAYAQAGRRETPPFWIAGGRAFTLDQPPYAVGLPYARVWQGIINVDRTFGGVALRVDENTADRASPSAPLAP